MDLLSLFVINVSFIVQLISAFVALRLILYSGKAPAGLLMLVGIGLMAFRRSISLYRVIGGLPIDLFAEIVACVISVTLLVGFLYFSRMVDHLEQEMRKRREAENTLKETNAQLQALIYAIPDMVVFKDIGGRHLLVNRTAEQFMGLKQEELIGKTNEELLPPDLAASCRRSDQEAMAGRGPVQTEEQFSGKDGKKIFLETVKTRIHDERGILRGMVAVSRDITERRQLIEQLEHLNRDLSERVREEIEKNRAQEQLMQLQSRHAAMGEMIDNIAHQWRQPLNNLGLIVQGMHAKFRSGTLTQEKLQEASKTAMSVIRYMSQTINDFTNFFRHDKEMVRFRIKDVAATALSFMDTSLKRNAIQVNADIPDDVTVKGYRNEYTQVLVNILNNARDVCVDRSVRNPAITLRAFRDNGTAVLTIADNGGGIPDDLMDKMFTPYFTTKPRNRGTGIGLYMSRMIIENNMNGRLSVCNRREGAEFRIEVRHGA